METLNLEQELRGLLGANIPLINLVTYEEERAVQALQSIEPRLGIYIWDMADLMQTIREADKPMPKKELTSDMLLGFLAKEAPAGCVVVLRDFHHVWNAKKGPVTRKLRNMVPGLRAKNQFLVMITPYSDLPMELKDDVVVIDVPPPDREAMGRLFDDRVSRLPVSSRPRPEVRGKYVAAALGLTTNRAALAFSRVYGRHDGFPDIAIAEVMEAKRQVIRESGALEYWSPEEDASGVGGLDRLKEWLTKRELGFTEDARRERLPFPKGVLLIGIPGTGKSLSAKMTARLWKMPLLRLDVGAVMGSHLGEAEANMRKAIQIAETVSPCILWLDEIEKAFAGSGAGAGAQASGAPRRVLGTFLTWMQERKSPVFVISTANDISDLPLELVGRFDRTFFLGLPNGVERREIWKIHLKDAGVPRPDFTLPMDALVERSRGYVGREIQRVVREAQFTAFADGNREMTRGDLELALKDVIPLSKSHAGVILGLERWVNEGLASPASSEELAVVGGSGRSIELGR